MSGYGFRPESSGTHFDGPHWLRSDVRRAAQHRTVSADQPLGRDEGCWLLGVAEAAEGLPHLVGLGIGDLGILGAGPHAGDRDGGRGRGLLAASARSAHSETTVSLAQLHRSGRERQVGLVDSAPGPKVEPADLLMT
jgi:hypothetical protein